jgi:hypothetical protein
MGVLTAQHGDPPPPEDDFASPGSKGGGHPTAVFRPFFGVFDRDMSYDVGRHFFPRFGAILNIQSKLSPQDADQAASKSEDGHKEDPHNKRPAFVVVASVRRIP